MMGSTSKALAGIALLTQLVPVAVQAAPPQNLATIITNFALPVEAITLPGLGKLSNFSIGTLGTLPGLSLIQIPFFGTLDGLPEIGNLTLSQETGLFVSLAGLQNPLAGFQAGSLSMLFKP